MNAPAEAFRCQALAKEIAAELRELEPPELEDFPIVRPGFLR
jgi:hypothetical protein